MSIHFKCKICFSKKIEKVLDLGRQPLANSLTETRVKPEKKYELCVFFCKSCFTPQLSKSLKPKTLFSNYVWRTSTSSLASKFSKQFSRIILQRIRKSKPNVLEIASNDGTFLKPFKKKGCKVIGVDPAKNIVNIAIKKNNINTKNGFFSHEFSKGLKKFEPDVIFARNVIAHVANIHSFVKGISSLINNNGIVAIEFHYVKKILESKQYDSIYHEHLFYFSLKTIEMIFKKYDLYAYDAVSSPISGGALIVLFKKVKIKKTKGYLKVWKREKKNGVNTINTWRSFSKFVKKHSNKFQEIINNLSKSGKIFAYGASARSSTLLNASKISFKQIEEIIDKNPIKLGKFTPGSKIKIISLKNGIKKIKKRKILILLAWNFKKEILKELRSLGYKGKIILPLPFKIKSLNV